jgi:protease-4
MNKKQFGCILAIVLILLCGSVLCNFVLLAIHGSQGLGSASIMTGDRVPRFGEVTVQNGRGPGKIAQINLRGIITSSASGELGETMVDDLKMQLHQAAMDNDVKAIVLYVDSPGGEVTASDVLYDAVCRARNRKPVVVYMGSLAASGGYYVSCGGTYLMADDTTFTGSIGVIIETLNYASLIGKIGVDMVVFKSGQFKDMLSGARPMTDAEKTYVQDMVMQTYGKFVGIVARERKLPEQQLRSGIADGRVISGRDALKDKLIDSLGQIEDAYDKARELSGASDAPVVRYQAEFRFGRLLKLFTGQTDSKVQIELPGSLAQHLEAGRLYFLPSFFGPSGS